MLEIKVMQEIFDWKGASSWKQRGDDDLLGKTSGDWFCHSVDINGPGDIGAVGLLFDNAWLWHTANVKDPLWFMSGTEENGCIVATISTVMKKITTVAVIQWHSVALSDARDVVVVGSRSPQTNAPYGHRKRGAATVYEWTRSQSQRGETVGPEWKKKRVATFSGSFVLILF